MENPAADAARSRRDAAFESFIVVDRFLKYNV